MSQEILKMSLVSGSHDWCHENLWTAETSQSVWSEKAENPSIVEPGLKELSLI